MNKKKIINDPIYGFIHVQHEILFDCIQLPEFQRLRRIKQLGLTHLVYPGALHTRFHHALGAMHLMQTAIETLRSKDVKISLKEEKGVLLAILLHDIGHGPFSHTLEHTLVESVRHEQISSILMNRINKKLGGKLKTAIEIFENKYPRKFLHQLVSSQLDMDRLDYLRRDSFYTGVSEGMVGIERIIQMLNVADNELVVEEKGIYSVEKFLMARRFMYWQVYLHKTTIAADMLLLSILNRAKELYHKKIKLFASPFLEFFLSNKVNQKDLQKEEILEKFCWMDDSDIISSVKAWQFNEDKILSTLCKMLINRDLTGIKIRSTAFGNNDLQRYYKEVAKELNIEFDEAKYFVSTGTLINTTYSSEGSRLKIMYKNGQLKDIVDASEAYNSITFKEPQVKYFITYLK